jgi:hypothetical protein
MEWEWGKKFGVILTLEEERDTEQLKIQMSALSPKLFN